MGLSSARSRRGQAWVQVTGNPPPALNADADSWPVLLPACAQEQDPSDEAKLKIAEAPTRGTSQIVSRVPSVTLLRVFVAFHGNRVVLLLDGYDKAADPSPKRQQREITAARKLLTAWRAQVARDLKDKRRGR